MSEKVSFAKPDHTSSSEYKGLYESYCICKAERDEWKNKKLQAVRIDLREEIDRLQNERDFLFVERDALKVERDKWKDEYFNLTKFANDLESQCGAFKEQLAEYTSTLKEIEGIDCAAKHFERRWCCQFKQWTSEVLAKYKKEGG